MAGKEHSSNYVLVCPAHEPKPGKYKDCDPKSFIGKHVKLGFPCQMGQTEHMWVLVHKVEEDKLSGELDNDPVLITDFDPPLKCGDWVEFETHEIEDVHEYICKRN